MREKVCICMLGVAIIIQSWRSVALSRVISHLQDSHLALQKVVLSQQENLLKMAGQILFLTTNNDIRLKIEFEGAPPAVSKPRVEQSRL